MINLIIRCFLKDKSHTWIDVAQTETENLKNKKILVIDPKFNCLRFRLTKQLTFLKVFKFDATQLQLITTEKFQTYQTITI